MAKQPNSVRWNETHRFKRTTRRLKWVAGGAALLIIASIQLAWTGTFLLPDGAEGQSPISIGFQEEAASVGTPTPPSDDPAIESFSETPTPAATLESSNELLQTELPTPTIVSIAAETDTPVPTVESLPKVTPEPVSGPYSPQTPISGPEPTMTPTPTPVPETLLTPTAIPDSELLPTPISEQPASPYSPPTPTPEDSATSENLTVPSLNQEGDFSTSALIDTTISLTLSPPSPIVGGTSMTAHVTFPPFILASGTVTYSVREGASCGDTFLAPAGTKTVILSIVGSSNSITFPASGTFSWFASYSGDLFFNPATACQTVNIIKSSPSVGLTLVPVISPLRAGGAATGQATLSGASATAGGTLTYRVYTDGTCTTLLTAVDNPSDVSVSNHVVPVSAAIVFDRSGTYYWRATYSGDDANNGAMSTCASQVVSKSTPILTLSLNPSPITVGASTTGTGLLTSITSVANGTMQYTVYSNGSCSTQLIPAKVSTTAVAGGIATNSEPFTLMAAGTYYVRAVYSGDANSNGSSSACASLVVSKTTTSVALTVTPSAVPFVAGGTAVGSATISNASVLAGGSLTYAAYSNSGCTSTFVTSGNPSTVTVSSGVAPNSASLAFPVNTTYYWKASYSGDSNNAASSSPCTSVVFNKASPALTLAPASSPVKTGIGTQSAATLSGATTTASGTLVYTVYTNDTCTSQFAILNNPSTVSVTNGTAPLSAAITFQTIGGLFERAVYAGDASNVGASSSCVAFTVERSDPNLSLLITPNIVPMKAGGFATARGTMTLATTTAAGSITYSVYVDSGCSSAYSTTGNPSTVSVTNHLPATSARLKLDLAATFYWSAEYSGDTNNNPASSPCEAFTVAIADPTLGLTIGLTSTPLRAEGTAYGKAVLTLSSYGAIGSVVYTVYSDSGCGSPYTTTGSPNTKTVVDKIVPQSDAIPFPNAGTFYWKASYSGDLNNNGAVSACVSQVVAKTDPFPWLAIYPTTYPMKVGGSLYGLLYLNGETSSVSGSMTFTAYSEFTCATPLTAAGSPNTVAVVYQVTTRSDPITISTAGTTYVRATYSGDANNSSVTSPCVAFVVGKATPAIILAPTASISPMTIGGTAYGKSTIVGSTATASGSVSYTAYTDSSCNTTLVTTNNPNSVTVVNKIAPNSTPITISIVGTVYWKASYTGDGNNSAAVSSCTGFVVAKTVPNLALVTNPSTSPMVAGGNASGSATLSNTTSSAGGSATYTVYSNNSCTTPTSPARISTKTVSLGVVPTSDAFTFDDNGTFYWRVTYTGDALNGAALSSCISLSVVDIGATTIDLSISPNPAFVEQSVSGQAVLAGTTGVPGGTVTYTVFEDGECSTEISPSQTSTETLSAGSVPASATFEYDSASTVYWSASYSGDATNASAVSSCTALTVSKTLTAVQLTIAPNPVEAGNAVVGVASISGKTSTASGSVIYGVYTNNGCSAQTSPAPESTVTVSAGDVPDSAPIIASQFGTSYWQARYTGDANNNSSTSSCVALNVSKATISITATTSPAGPKVGESILLNATLNGSTSTAGGSVTYIVYSEQTCATKIIPNQQSTKTTVDGVTPSSDAVTFLQTRVVYWQAVYSGDANNLTASSQCQTLRVNKATPTLTIEQDPNPINIGEELTVHAALSADAVSPTGTVTFGGYQDSDCLTLSPGIELFVAVLVNGVVPDLPPTIFDFATTIYGQATYSGDANNAPATSLCSAAVVAKGLSLSVTLDPASTILHSETSSAQATWPSADTPVGSITYTAFAGADCTGTQLDEPETVTISGNAVAASTAIAFADPGDFSWQASYPGDAIYNPIAICTPLIVQATPTLTLLQDPKPINIGEEFTVHLTLSADAISPTGSVTASAYTDDQCSIPAPGFEPYTAELVNGLVPDAPPRIFNFPGIAYGQGTYTGDAYNAGTTSACSAATIAESLSLVVTLDPGATILHGETSAAVATWTAIDTPTGQITYTSFTGTDCSGTPFSAAEAVDIISNAVDPSTAVLFADPGSYSWQASYPGDAIYNPITICTPLIVQATPSLSLVQLPNPVKIGEAFTGHMELSADAVNPTGTVTLSAFTSGDCLTPFPGLDSYVVQLVDGLIEDPPLLVFNFAGLFYAQAAYSGDAINAPTATTCEAVTIEVNPLTAAINSAVFTPVEYSQAETINSAEIVMTVTDERGTGEGWSISMRSSALAYDGTSAVGTAIPAGNLSIVSIDDPDLLFGEPVGAGGPNANTGGIGTMDQSRAVITAAPGYGTGSYSSTIGITILIPAASQTGTYTATVEILIAAAP
ncbi:hypothetical protein BH09CHL1_BH09CHL1_06530 [soil metagenome]